MAREFHIDLDLNAHKVTDLAPGTAGTDAVNKNQLDAAASTEIYAQAAEPGAGAVDILWVDIDDTSGGAVAGGSIVVVSHGTDGAVARPTAAVVYWVGTATPANGLPYDFWRDV